MTSRRDGIPVFIPSDGRSAEPLCRLSFGERTIDESWLQRLLFDYPELIPIEDIDPGYGPIVAAQREILTPVGPMDNLYISPQGLLTIVETKLWRNPEARRQVVGQIIDYAKEVSRWSFNDLDRKVRQFAGKGLWELVSRKAEDVIDEARFVDAVIRNMRSGRFLLRIIGDGIREELEHLADFLQSTPQLQFTLGLVEMQVCQLHGQAARSCGTNSSVHGPCGGSWRQGAHRLA
ncbi:MAG: hypothetical protein J5I93_24925 [Pirellulaceae bacterium]|nr:hypothetical protein [Pirellulaceae bacterium]